MSEKVTRRLFVLIASVITQICLGVSYSWSSFVPSLKEYYGISITQSQSIFSAVTITTTIFVVIGGRLQDTLGPRLPTLIGGLLLGAGYMLASFSAGNFSILFITIGIISGIGIGLSYMAPIACAMKWFPKQKSIVTGVIVAGFGGSPIIISRLFEYLLSQKTDILHIFKIIGIAFIIVLSVSASILGNPDTDRKLVAKKKLDYAIVLKDRHFWALLCGMFPCACVGLVIIGNMKSIGLSKSIDWIAAGRAIGRFGLFDAIGRIGWGFLGELVKMKRLILISIMLTAAICFFVAGPIQHDFAFQSFAILAGFIHGACMVLYTADVAIQYGVEQMGSVYSMLFLSNVLSPLVGPLLAGRVYDSSASYTRVFIVWGFILILSSVAFTRLYGDTRNAEGGRQ